MHNKRTLSLLLAIVFVLAAFTHPAMGKATVSSRSGSASGYGSSPCIGYTKGDINMDGNVNTSDAILAMRYTLGLGSLTCQQIALGDMNHDGEVSIADSNIIRRIAMGFVETTVMSDITNQISLVTPNQSGGHKLLDGDENTYVAFDSAVTLSITTNEGIGGVYIKFDCTPPHWTLNTKLCGQYGFLHEFQYVEGNNTQEITLCFSDAVSIADIFVFSLGDEPPAGVQVWRPAEGPCDIMLISAHSDDDQLFFAGAIPDAIDRGAEMQVCFLTNHWNTNYSWNVRSRRHELLNALWTCGLTRYPEISSFPDDGKSAWLNHLNCCYYMNAVADYEAGLIRAFKPQIVLTHDVHGEYAHPAHIAAAKALIGLTIEDCATHHRDCVIRGALDRARSYADDENVAHQVSKAYLHCCNRVDEHGQPEHNAGIQITFNADRALTKFGGYTEEIGEDTTIIHGPTPYRVSQQAFKCHGSQMGTPYRYWLLGNVDKPLEEFGNPFTLSENFGVCPEGNSGAGYSPRYYELYYRKEGLADDVNKVHFYEHITLLNGVTY